MRSIFLEPSHLEDFSYCMTSDSHDEIILRYAASKLGGYLDTQRVRAVQQTRRGRRGAAWPAPAAQ
jgi:hypothetical protein